MSMTETRVNALIESKLTAALQPGGRISVAIEKVVGEAISKGVLKGGLIEAGAVGVAKDILKEALGPSGNATICAQQQANEAVRAASYEIQSGKHYPYLKHLRSMTPEKFSTAWKGLMTDPDNVDAVIAAMGDQGFASIMALSAAYEGNSELKRLKEAAAMKSAPKVSLKDLCLKARGGGPDRLLVYLAEKSEAKDADVKALARALQQIYYLVERRFTVAQSVKKSGPVKAEQQRQEMMQFLYQTYKAFKKRTSKATASLDLDREVLVREFAPDMLTALATMQTVDRRKLGDMAYVQDSVPASAKKRSAAALAEDAAGNGVSFSDAAGPGVVSAKDEAEEKRRKLAQSFEGDLVSFVTSNPTATEGIENYIDGKFKAGGQSQRAMAAVLSKVCRNCLMHGKGIVYHQSKACPETCKLVCRKCMDKGRGKQFHFRRDCPLPR